MLTGHIEFGLGDLYASTFDTALDQQEQAMIAAPMVGTIYGIGDLFKSARDSALTVNGIGQDLYGTYFSDESAGYSQKLYQDMANIADGLKPVSAIAAHSWDVAQQHDNGVTNSGYANPETYKQIASDTVKFAGTAGEAFSNLPPAQQIELVLRADASLLTGLHTQWSAIKVGGLINEVKQSASVEKMLNKLPLPELSIWQPAAEGPTVAAMTTADTDSNILMMKAGPNHEGFATGKVGVGEKFPNGRESVIPPLLERALPPEQVKEFIENSLKTGEIDKETGLKIAEALKDRLRSDFPEIDKQNLAFAIVERNGVPSIVYSFKGIDFPGPKITDDARFPYNKYFARNTDSEYRLLVDLAQQIDVGSIDKTQSIMLFTEQKPCSDTCKKTIARFEKELAIKLKVTHKFEKESARLEHYNNKG